MKPLLIAISVLVAFAHRTALADSDFKREVFENCEAATESLGTIPAAEHADITSYLVRIVELPLSSRTPELFEPFAGQPAGSPLSSHHEDLHDSTLWRTFQPSREVEAKRCAVRLLERLYPTSASALSSLVVASRDSIAPLDLRNEIEKVLWKLAMRLRNDTTFVLDRKGLGQLLTLTEGTTSALASNILVEISPHSLPSLIEQLSKPDDAMRERISSILLRIDDSGELLGERLKPLLRAGSEEVRERTAGLLTKLPGYYPQAFSELVLRLEDPSPAVANACFAALAKISSELQQRSEVHLEPISLDTLTRALSGLDTAKRDVAEQALKTVIMFQPESALPFAPLISGKDADVARRAVKIVGASRKALPELYSTIYNAAFDADIFVRVEAIPVLARFAPTSEERDGALLRVLKGLASEKDPGARELLIAAVAEASGLLTDPKTKERLIPYFIEALAAPEIGRSGAAKDRVAEALISIGAPAQTALRKLLSKEDPRVRERAVALLGEIKPFERATAKLLVPLLRDRDSAVRAKAEQEFGSRGALAEEDLRKALSWPEKAPRASVARIAQRSGLSDSRIPVAVVDQFASTTCRERVGTVRDVLTAAPFASEAIEILLVQCLGSNDGVEFGEVLNELVSLSPLQDAARASVSAQLSAGTLGRELGLRVLERARELGIDDAITVSLLDSYVKSGDDALKHRAVTLLGDLFAAGEQNRLIVAETQAAVTGALGTILDEGELSLRLKAAVALLRVGGDTRDARQLLLKELDDDGFQWALSALDEVKLGGGAESEVSGVLAESLAELPNRSRYEVLRVLAKRGTHAANAVPAVLKLVNNPDPLLRYHATFALALIDSAAPYIVEPLRRELIGDYGVKFVSDKLCGVLGALEAAQIQEPRSFVEQRYIRLLRNRCEKL